MGASRKATKTKYSPRRYVFQRAFDEYKINVENPKTLYLYAYYFKRSELKVENPKMNTCATLIRYNIKG